MRGLCLQSIIGLLSFDLYTCRQVIAQWTTNAQAAGAVVQYGTTSGMYTGSANATFDTYTASDMCGGEAATTGYLFPGES